MGIDRMTMFLSNTDNIKEVLLFPAMKPVEEHPHAAAAAATGAPAAASSSAAPAAAPKHNIGGIGQAKPADDDAKAVLTRATPLLHEKLPKHAGVQPELVSYALQSVAGRNYFMKVKFGAAVVHARVYRNLKDEVSLHSVQENQTVEAPIAYFENSQ